MHHVHHVCVQLHSHCSAALWCRCLPMKGLKPLHSNAALLKLQLLVRQIWCQEAPATHVPHCLIVFVKTSQLVHLRIMMNYASVYIVTLWSDVCFCDERGKLMQEVDHSIVLLLLGVCSGCRAPLVTMPAEPAKLVGPQHDVAAGGTCAQLRRKGWNKNGTNKRDTTDHNWHNSWCLVHSSNQVDRVRLAHKEISDTWIASFPLTTLEAW